MFSKLGLRGKLYFGFGMVVAIILGLGVFIYMKMATVRMLEKLVTGDCLPGMASMAQVEGMARQGYEMVPEMLAAKTPDDRQDIETALTGAMDELDKALANYETTITQPEDRDLYSQIAPARAEYAKILNDQVLPLCHAGKIPQATEIFFREARSKFTAYVETIRKLSDWNADHGKDIGNRIKIAVIKTLQGLAVGLGVAVLVSALLGFFLSRSITVALRAIIDGLSAGSRQISGASGQVSQSSQSLAEGASVQASSLEETSASLEELSSMTKQNSDNARQANAMAGEASASAVESRAAMDRMGQAIGKIKASADETAKIIKTIDEIAFQTNLLALNAAVEAARAGDAGKGFAVVAEEVRNLARRSAEAAKSTSSLIEDAQKNADNGVSVSGEVGSILGRIAEKVQKLSGLVGEVSAASDEQTKGISQISIAVTEMDKVTQSNAASAEESASASEELFAQSRELGDMVSTLVGIVNGASKANAAFAAPEENPKQPLRKPMSASAFQERKPAKTTVHMGTVAHEDWSTGAKKKALPGQQNRQVPRTVSANGHAVDPEKVIPMDDGDLGEF